MSNCHTKLILLLCFCSSCIEPFDPVINENEEVMVIDGVITDRPGKHSVTISRSTPYNDAFFAPLGGCVVSVTDNTGNMEFYSEDLNHEGVYEAILDEPFLGVGKSYSVQVITPSGQVYVSDYDTLLSCPPVDSLYYKKKISGGENPDDDWHGIRFYNDVRGRPGGTRNFRWKATATWIYHSPLYPVTIIYYGIPMKLLEDTVSTCYMTESIATIFAASTRLLTENSIYQNGLYYVSDQTPRLRERYSLFLEQQSLTDQAYYYWSQMATLSGNSATLYETQPSGIRGNLYNANRPSEKVLGYFYATQIQEKRIFIDCRELGFKVWFFRCIPDTLRVGLPKNKIYYLTADGLWAPSECFDCTLLGGDNEVPDFW